MVTATQLMQFSQKFHKYELRQFAPLMEESGLSMREFQILLFLSNNPDYDTARDIVELRGLVKSQVSQAVELLCGRKLLLRRPDKADRRVVHLAMTEGGRALGKRAQALQSHCYAQLLRGFSHEEERTLHGLLEKVLENGSRLQELL